MAYCSNKHDILLYIFLFQIQQAKERAKPIGIECAVSSQRVKNSFGGKKSGSYRRLSAAEVG